MARVIYLGGLYGAVGSWMVRAAVKAGLHDEVCRSVRS
jgi:prephenate dehydrogenase